MNNFFTPMGKISETNHVAENISRPCKLIAPYPLTLTLSLGEREQPLDAIIKFVRCAAEFSRCFAEALGTFLPLRVGVVGGADGERAGVRCSFHQIRVQAEWKTTNPLSQL